MATRSRIKDFFWRHSAGIAFLVMVCFVGFLAFVGYTYVVITKKFDSSRRWDLPSRIYSDATPLVPGMTIPRALLEPKLNHVGYHEVAARVDQSRRVPLRRNTLEIYLQNFEYPDIEFRALPVAIEMDGGTVRGIKRLDDGVALRGIRIEPELITSIYNNEMEDRLPVSLSAVPKVVSEAIISTEDKNFYHHEGISIRGTLGALVTDIRNKNIDARRLDADAAAHQELLSQSGADAGAQGARGADGGAARGALQQAADSRGLSQRDLPRTERSGADRRRRAGLAGLLRQTRHLPDAARGGHAGGHHPLAERAVAVVASRSRQGARDTVLQLMKEQGYITPERVRAGGGVAADDVAISEDVAQRAVLRRPRAQAIEGDVSRDAAAHRGAARVHDARHDHAASAEQSLDSGIDALNKHYPYLRKSPTPLEGVILTIQPGTGYVKALVGGRSYSKTQFNRAIQARRQPGSLFKPFVYATAMDPARGQQAFTAATVLDDSPISIRTGNAVWTPQNYDLRYHGQVTVREALAHSYNIPAVRAAMNAGVPNVIKTAATIGIESHLEPYPSVSLGSFEVTPLEIAYAYSAFANLGVKAEPISILAVSTREGKLLESREVKMKRVAPASVCYVMNDVLKDVFEFGTASKARAARIRASVRRKDRDDEQLPRRLVHRLFAAHPLAGLARLRRRPQRPSRRRRRLRPDLDDEHESRRRPDSGRRLETPRGCRRPPDRSAVGDAGHAVLPADEGRDFRRRHRADLGMPAPRRQRRAEPVLARQHRAGADAGRGR